MSQPNLAATTERKRVVIPKYLVISILTIFSIGSQYFINLSYTLNQMIIQNELNLSTHSLTFPSTLSNLAFALGVPLGPVLSKKYGLRSNYLTFIFLFLCGAIISTVSFDVFFLTLGRIIQGLSSGILFLTILPVSLISFPNKIRNTFLIMAIAGLFGASGLGAIFGSLSLTIDDWRWLFILNIISSSLCLLIGYVVLPKAEQQMPPSSIDKKRVFLLSLIVFVLAFPLCQLQEEGFASITVWPLLGTGFLLSVLFIYLDLHSETPYIPFPTLKAMKPISGTVMAIASHVVLVLALAGITGFLRNNKDLPFEYIGHFFIWFFLGILASALISTFLYDKLGAGILGIIGSLLVVYVSFKWRIIEVEVSLHSLYLQIFLIGLGVSLVLVSGALGTALAGDIHKASMRSITLHSVRNFIGAIIAPVIGWFLVRQNAIYYENLRGQYNQYDPLVQMEVEKLTHYFINNGLSTTAAKSMAVYKIVADVKRASILGAYHDLFTIMLLFAFVMLVASIGKCATGKGISLVQKPK